MIVVDPIRKLTNDNQQRYGPWAHAFLPHGLCFCVIPYAPPERSDYLYTDEVDVYRAPHTPRAVRAGSVRVLGQLAAFSESFFCSVFLISVSFLFLFFISVFKI
jgi:hypothetical protein